jgi:acyl-CoA thioester hydrolase
LGAIHRFPIVVSTAAIDANHHANNIEYVRWMQEAAISHSDSAGCTAATKSAGASWVVRSHYVEYLLPAFAGERLVILTWVSTLRRASSLRKYLFLRENDRAVVARGETSWIFVDRHPGVQNRSRRKCPRSSRFCPWRGNRRVGNKPEVADTIYSKSY